MTKISLISTSMQMIRIGKGSVGKEFWQVGSIDRRHRHLRVGHGRKRVGCCARVRLCEENARFALLVCIMFIYLCCGATLFHFIEHEQEEIERNRYVRILQQFKRKYCRTDPASVSSSSSVFNVDRRSSSSIRHQSKTNPKKKTTAPSLGAGRHWKIVNCTELDELLNLRGNLSAAGLMTPRLKWDWAGSFYFVGTVVSTIGFGMTSPHTTGGRVLVIVYGFFGCAGAFLLFNLFLERVITLFAYILRYIHERGERRRARSNRSPNPKIRVHTPDSDSASSASSLEQWRPSVYTVMLCLFIVSSILVLSAACVYHSVENWTYFESVYFCFVSFSTIGLGDYVSSQQQSNDTRGVHFYRAANFLFLTLGCCCIYSLFNVTSIVIRHLLNRIIRAWDCHCGRPKWLRRKERPYLGLGLRPPKERFRAASDSDSEDTTSRRLSGDSGGMISLKEFLELNKLNLCRMQKHIIESAQHRMHENHYDASTAISATAVGPLAILTQKFGED